MLLGFKPRFAQYVEEGSKTHTIRAKRKIPPKVGETCHCYTGLRQKGARLLGRFRCVRVESIVIRHIERPGVPLCVEIEGIQLSPDETDAFFWRDGFRPMLEAFAVHHSIEMAADFWKLGETSFEGYLIHWEYTR
jgi:hypothetical protein